MVVVGGVAVNAAAVPLPLARNINVVAIIVFILNSAVNFMVVCFWCELCRCSLYQAVLARAETHHVY